MYKMTPNFTPRAQLIIATAKKLAQKHHNTQVNIDHLFLSFLKSDSFILPFIIEHFTIDYDGLCNLVESSLDLESVAHLTDKIQFSESFKSCLELSHALSHSRDHSYISVEHLLYATLIHDESSIPEYLMVCDINFSDFKDMIENMLDTELNTTPLLLQKTLSSQSDSQFLTSASSSKILDQYSVDLNELSKSGLYDNLYSYGNYVERIEEILCRRTKSSVVLVGEAGVGKTALVESLSNRISNLESNEFLINKKVLSLDLFSMVAGTKYRGQFEERLKSFIDAVKKDKNIILFIDEIHTLVGAGNAEGSMDAANILKPYIARGELTCIGATTFDEYKKSISKDAALKRRFAVVKVHEPSEQESINILKSLCKDYSEFHSVSYSNDAIEQSVFLSNKYINNKKLPDKAIDLLDQAGAQIKIKHFKKPHKAKQMETMMSNDDLDPKAKGLIFDQYKKIINKWSQSKLNNLPTVEEKHIKKIISESCGIPMDVLIEEESNRLKGLYNKLSKSIVGQADAIDNICNALYKSQAGLKDPNRPIASFLFLGKTGLGKTLTAKAIAKHFFGGEKNLIYFDMSEFSESASVSKLVGASPGYIGYEKGGELTEKVKRNPYSIVLFDEIEKASNVTLQSLLQVLEEGRLTDNNGEETSFKNCVVIMTSNVGAFVVDKQTQVGFSPSAKKSESKVLEEAKKILSPEFINRLDSIVIFNNFDQKDLSKIVTLEFAKIKNKLKSKNIHCTLSKSSRDYIIKQAQEENLGGRPIRRIMQSEIETLIAKTIIQNDKNVKNLLIKYKEGNFCCNILCEDTSRAVI